MSAQLQKANLPDFHKLIQSIKTNRLDLDDIKQYQNEEAHDIIFDLHQALISKKVSMHHKNLSA